MELSTTAQSSTLRHIGPTLSKLHAPGIIPLRLTRPNVVRKAVTPQRIAGSTMDPPVSVPMANATKPAAVAEPGPAEEPPEPSVVSHGFFVCPPNQTSSCANSPVASFATSTAPALFRRSTTVASVGIICCLKGGAPHVVGYPLFAIRSFAPQGIPCSGPR